MTQMFGAGKSLESGFSLLEMCGHLSAGEYEISAIYEYDGGHERAESPPIRIAVRPALPRNLSLDTVQGSVVYGVWLNMATEPPHLVRSRFDLLSGGGVGETRALGTAGLHARPIPSLPPNRAPCESHWVAWIEEGALKFLHFDPELGPTPVETIALPPLEAEIVGPLHSEPTTDLQTRPAGSALLWMGNREGTISRLREAALVPGPLPSGPPRRPGPPVCARPVRRRERRSRLPPRERPRRRRIARGSSGSV